MKTKKFNNLIAAMLKTRGIIDFKITQMKLENKNYYVNEQGMLQCEKHMDVTVLPRKSNTAITININITPSKDDNN